MAQAHELGDVLVLGLGSTGEAVARYLVGVGSPRVRSVTLYGGASSAPGARTEALEALGVACVTGTEEVEGRYDLAVASPGIPEGSAFAASAREHAKELVGEPELAWRESPERWVGITGTNGKTTTTTLTGHLLEAGGLSCRLVGNIGTNVISCVADRGADEWFVAELSSFQLAETRLLHPRVACLLNVTPDHVEWHGSLEAYAAAKERLFARMTAEDLAVVSEEDDWCRAVCARLEARGVGLCRLDVHAEPPSPSAAFVRDGVLVVRLDGVEHELARADELPIIGDHNVENALAASAMALALGVGPESVRAGLLSFRPLEHRIEPCGEVGGVRFVNDSKATNTDAVEKALAAFPAGRVVVLLGGHDKGTSLDSLARAVCRDARVAVCFGAAGERIARSLEDARDRSGAALSVVRSAHLREAFAAAVAQARPGDTVLLSPACSSFDEFSNMAERGRLFKQLVRDLAAGRS